MSIDALLINQHTTKPLVLNCLLDGEAYNIISCSVAAIIDIFRTLKKFYGVVQAIQATGLSSAIHGFGSSFGGVDVGSHILNGLSSARNAIGSNFEDLLDRVSDNALTIAGDAADGISSHVGTFIKLAARGQLQLSVGVPTTPSAVNQPSRNDTLIPLTNRRSGLNFSLGVQPYGGRLIGFEFVRLNNARQRERTWRMLRIDYWNNRLPSRYNPHYHVLPHQDIHHEF